MDERVDTLFLIANNGPELDRRPVRLVVDHRRHQADLALKRLLIGVKHDEGQVEGLLDLIGEPLGVAYHLIHDP
ncbi:hypothetical protein D3C86_2238340 [compost metagenome]